MKTKKSKKKKKSSLIMDSEQRERIAFLNQFVSNMEISRQALARLWSGKGEEDVDEECGYPETVDFHMADRMFRREGIARRVVTLYPTECWSVSPWVYETEKVQKTSQTKFEKEWIELDRKHNIISKLYRADVVSGIGRYGVLLIGLDDGKRLSRRVEGINEDGEQRKGYSPKKRKILYLMPFSEGEAQIESYQEDRSSLRYGKPLYYNLNFADPSSPNGSSGTTEKVHWSRCIHIADNCTTNDVLGNSRLEWCYNYILNIRKILGGGAEMFWKGGFPGLSIQTLPGLETEIDKKSVEKEVSSYMKKLKRYLAMENLDVKTLQPNIESPGNHIDAQLTAIAIAIEAPKRFLMGTEEARMASIQDSESWNKRVNRRHILHCSPNMVRPLVDRLMLMGALSKVDQYFVGWPDLYSVSKKDQADITGVLVRALAQYITSGASRMFPPMEFLTHIMDFTIEQASEIVAAAEKEVKKQDSGKSIALSPKLLMGPTGSPMAGGSGQARVQNTPPFPRNGRQATRQRDPKRR